MNDRWRCVRCDHEFEEARGEKPIECPGCGKSNNKTNFEALSGPYRFFDEQNEKFIPKWLADHLIEINDYMVHPTTDQMYVYDFEDGIYIDEGQKVAEVIAREKLDLTASTHKVNETVEQIRRTRSVMVEEKEINEPLAKIVLGNGVLDIAERELEPYNPKYKHLVKIPVKYDPDCECPKIIEFISQVVDEDNIPVIQEMFGYCLLRDYPFAKAFMMLGSGANGKSTLLNLLTIFLGEGNIATPSLQDLLRDRFSKIELYGKLANIHSDLSSSSLYNLGVFKMLTGGDKVRGQIKYVQRTLSFVNTAKLVYACNRLPMIEEMDDAFLRRWIIIDFPNTFREGEDADPHILDKITSPGQLSGLLNWALDGLDRVLMKGGFTMTKSRDDIEKQWLRMSDSLQAFLKECVKVSAGDWVEKDELYETYAKYCLRYNLDMKDVGMMTRKMKTFFPQARLSQKRVAGARPRVWNNIRVEDDWIIDNGEEELDIEVENVTGLNEYS